MIVFVVAPGKHLPIAVVLSMHFAAEAIADAVVVVEYYCAFHRDCRSDVIEVVARVSA